MTLRRRRRARTAALAALVLGLALTACGSAPSERGRPASATPFDAGLHAALPAEVRTSRVLEVGTDAAYAPASAFAADGRTIVGFEPALGAALGRVLGVRVRFVNRDFSGLLGDVARHRVDLAMSAMTDTPERERRVDFVNYFSAGTGIVVQRGNPAGITDLAGLCGRIVAVEAGTVQVDLLRRSQRHCHGGRIVIRTFETNADALLHLRTGRASAVLNDYPPATELTTSPSTRAHYQLASTAQYEPGLYGIAVAKDRPRLRDAVRAALTRVMRSGEYAAILRRWNVADGAIETASVNAAGIN